MPSVPILHYHHHHAPTPTSTMCIEKQRAFLQKPDLPSSEREDTLLEPPAICTRISQGREVTAELCKPKRPLMARGIQLVKHSNCLNTLQLLDAAIDDRKWEILYFPAEASRAFQLAGMQFEPGCLLSWPNSCVQFESVLPWRSWFIPCPQDPWPCLHPCTQLLVLNPFCVKHLVWFRLSCVESEARHTTHTPTSNSEFILTLAVTAHCSPAVLWFVPSSLA